MTERIEQYAKYKVMVSDIIFERMGLVVEWGQPDAEGFYTPAFRTGPQSPDGTMVDALNRCSDSLSEALRKVQSLRELTTLQADRIHELEDEAGDDSYLDDEPEVPSGGPD